MMASCEGNGGKNVAFSNIKALLLDIEGTTTSISFVKDILFPYIRKHLTGYLKENWGGEELIADVHDLRLQAAQDEAIGMAGVVKIPDEMEDNVSSVQEAVTANVLWQMDADRKTTALKQLQGHMWKAGYDNAVLKAHVYKDVPPAMTAWHHAGKKIYIYSSGSVQAQKLLFSCTLVGSLLQFLDGYFDTTVGPKFEPQSYEDIVSTIGCKPAEVLFLTDVPKEAKAAKTAGLQAVLVVREGNAPLTEADKMEFIQITLFSQLTL